MIEKMRKLSLLLYYKEKEQFLSALQDVGLVHLCEHPDKDMTPLLELQAHIKRTEQALTIMPMLPDVQRKALPAPETTPESDALIAELVQRKEDVEANEQQLQQLAKELALLAPWGEFDIEVLDRLRQAGLSFSYYRMKEDAFGLLDQARLGIEIINRQDDFFYFVHVQHTGEEAREIPGAEQIRLPHKTHRMVRDEMRTLEHAQREHIQRMEQLSLLRPQLETHLQQLQDELAFKSAHYDLLPALIQDKPEERIITLSGYFPEANESRVRSVLDGFTNYYLIDTPAPEDDVPIKLKNGPFAKLFEPITEIYQLPHYQEIDSTPFIAPFFALFFGLCLGDVGYGAIIFLLGLIARFKVSDKLKPSMTLLTVLGGMTVLAGVVLNTAFGHNIFGGPGIGASFFSSGAKYAPLGAFEMGKGTVYPAMSFALLCGFIQIVVGMVLRIINKLRMEGFIYTLQPIGYLCMFLGGLIWAAHINFLELGLSQFAIGTYQLGWILTSVPQIGGQVLLYGGLGLLLLFNNPLKSIFVRPLLGLYDLYSFASALIGDVLSYLRLFALGLGSGLLGAAFNQIGLMFITDKSGQINFATPWIVATVLVLVVGHLINFLLSAVGSFVHPLRLTFVEFYRNLEFRGGGKAYMPLLKHTKQVHE